MNKNVAQWWISDPTLKWREFNNAADKSCNLCSTEVETLEHFMLDCIKLNDSWALHARM